VMAALTCPECGARLTRVREGMRLPRHPRGDVKRVGFASPPMCVGRRKGTPRMPNRPHAPRDERRLRPVTDPLASRVLAAARRMPSWERA